MTDDLPSQDLTLEDPLAQRLTAQRPAPAAPYRGALRRRLLALGPPAARPEHLYRLVALYAVVGILCLLVGVLSLAGIGPLGP